MEDSLIFFEPFPHWGKPEDTGLYFSLVSWNMKPNADIVTEGGRERLEHVHISETNKKYKQTLKNKNG